MFRRAIQIVLAAVVIAAGSSLAVAANHKSTARLHGSPIMKGQAKYWEKLVNGHRDQRFKVQVARALPLQPLQVSVNGRPVGVAIANIGGSARLSLRTGGKGRADPLPAGFPCLRNGDVVTVGPLAGVCFENGHNAVFSLEGKVEVDGAEYKAEYKERQKNGTLDRSFEVEIEGGAPNTTFDVFVNENLVGSITTNSLGDASLEFQSAAGDDCDDDGDHTPLPADFPSLLPGDTVRIGDVTVTLGSGDDDDDDHNSGPGGDDDDDDDHDDDDHGGHGDDD